MSDITREAIEQDRQARIQECAEQISELLEEYDCHLVATPRIEDGRIVADVKLLSRS
jgi:hypothetical protein